MNFKPNYFIIPSIAIFVSTLGRYFSAQGIFWYQTLQLPWFVPPQWLYSLIWTTVFSLTTVVAVIAWNRFSFARRYKVIIVLFVLNALANVLWRYFFFIKQDISLALVNVMALEISVLLLIAFIIPVSRSVALLLLPYALWGAFGCFLNYVIWTMN